MSGGGRAYAAAYKQPPVISVKMHKACGEKTLWRSRYFKPTIPLLCVIEDILFAACKTTDSVPKKNPAAREGEGSNANRAIPK